MIDPVDALIASKTRVPVTSDEARAAVQRVVTYNDGVSAQDRVGEQATVNMLREHFKWTGGRHSLDNVCRSMGRKSFKVAS